MDCLCTGVEVIAVLMCALIVNLRKNRTTLIRDGTRAACDQHINVMVADFTAIFAGYFTSFSAGSVPAGEAAPLRSNMLVGLDVVLSESVQLPTDVGDALIIEKTVTDLIGDESPSHHSASRAVNPPSIAGCHDDRPLAI